MLVSLGPIVPLIVILIAAEVFTNALEHLGERLRISEGVTGSLFAAVATAMPEASIPLLAIFAGTEDQALNEEIGVGAILGAPLMLSTLALLLVAVATLAHRKAAGTFTPEITGLTRDLNFFLFAFALATVALFVPSGMEAVRVALSAALVLTYFIYVLLTVRASAALVSNGHATAAHKRVFLARLGLPENFAVILLQLALGLGLLIGGAKGFIHEVEQAARALGVSALLLSLLIVPIATELPEKVNSVLWIRRGRDTLAFGNITGAMVFQGTLLPAIGILLTPWQPRREVFTGIVVALLGAAWLRWLVQRGRLRVWHMGINGTLYVAYIIAVLA